MGVRGRGTPLSYATNQRNTLNSEWRKHVKTCGKCLTTTAARSRYCDDGWHIAKDLAAARARVDELREQIVADNPTLF